MLRKVVDGVVILVACIRVGDLVVATKDKEAFNKFYAHYGSKFMWMTWVLNLVTWARIRTSQGGGCFEWHKQNFEIQYEIQAPAS